MPPKPKLYASGFDFPEGPVIAGNGELVVVNLHGGTIAKVPGKKRVTTWVDTGGGPNGAQYHPNGHLYVCDAKLKAILDISPGGEIERVVTGWDGHDLLGPNDLIFSDDGGYYFTDPVGSSQENPIGAVYRVDPDGTVHRCVQNLAFPNGICLSPDGRRLFVAETSTHVIHGYAMRPDGIPAAGRVHATVPEGGEGPDGMAVDVDGALYVAWYGMGKVLVIDRWGEISDEIVLPGANPTNVAFGGKDMRTLFITETETNAVYTVKVKTPGHPLLAQR